MNRLGDNRTFAALLLMVLVLIVINLATNLGQMRAFQIVLGVVAIATSAVMVFRELYRDLHRVHLLHTAPYLNLVVAFLYLQTGLISIARAVQ